MKSRFKKSVALLGFLILVFSRAQGETIVGTVIEVPAGDVIAVDAQGKEIKVRLYGVVCPKGNRPFSNKASFFTTNKALSKKVHVEIRKSGNNYVEGMVYVNSDTSRNAQILKAGLGRWDSTNAPHEGLLALLQKNARMEGRGIWKTATSARKIAGSSVIDPSKR